MPDVRAVTIRYRMKGAISTLKSVIYNPKNTAIQTKSVDFNRSYSVPNNFFANTLKIVFTVQRLPDVCGVYLAGFKGLPDLPLFQNKYAVRG